MTVRVGFTGTRVGMTPDQRLTVAALLDDVSISWVHHGDCIGADADFHRIARAQGLKIKGHPPTEPALRAWCDFDEIAEPKPYLDRDRDIVAETAWLIATPKESVRRSYGGTWRTVGFASEATKPTVIVWPDGSLEREPGNR